VGKGKGKVHLKQAPKARGGGGLMNSSNLSLTSVLDGVRGHRFTPGKDQVPIVENASGLREAVWTGAEKLATAGIRSPDRPARSDSLYRLSYPGPIYTLGTRLFQGVKRPGIGFNNPHPYLTPRLKVE